MIRYLLWGSLLLGCGNESAGSTASVDSAPTRGPRLPGSAGSVQELGTEIVRSLVSGDSARLERFRLGEAEYRDLVWAKLPEGDRGIGMSYEFSRLDLQMRSLRALRRYLFRMKGLPLRAADTRCKGKRLRYDGFDILQDCFVVVADTATGRKEEIQLFPSVVVMNGGYKIFRYED